MPVTINGTNGVTTPEVVLDNSAADGAQVVLKSSGYSDWNLDNYSGRLRAYYGSTEYWTVNASGNLGLGVTPSAWGSGFKAFEVGRAGSGFFSVASDSLQITNNYYYNGTNYIYAASGYAERYHMVSGQHQWYTAPSGTAGNAISFTQAMTLDSSGNLLVGTTSGAFSSTTSTGMQVGQSGQILCSTTGTSAIFRITSTGTLVQWRYQGTVTGDVTTNGTTTAYNTSSDYRLKHDIAPMTGALAKVAQLKPCTYKWNADNSQDEGFIAHELQEVCPSAVTGEKDAVDAEGNPQYQGIDTSFLVATLTAAIQELKAIVDAQGAEIAALKGTA